MLHKKGERERLLLLSTFAFSFYRGLVSPTRRIPKLRAESQQIAAWKLLYRVQHPARYVSRLQTIPSSNIEIIVIPMIDRQEVWSDVARIDPAADR